MSNKRKYKAINIIIKGDVRNINNSTFLVQSEIQRRKEAVELLKKGKLVSCEIPDELVTDDLQSYAKTVKQEFSGCSIVHVQSSLRKGLNNKIERVRLSRCYIFIIAIY